jgi:DNA modification methylase
MSEDNVAGAQYLFKGAVFVQHSFKHTVGSIDLKPFYSNKDTSCVLYHASSLDIMDSIPTGSINMIFADPPYFLSNGGMSCHAGRRVCVNKGEWDKSKGIEETHKFNLEWLKRCQNILTKDGTIWVSGTSHVFIQSVLPCNSSASKFLTI